MLKPRVYLACASALALLAAGCGGGGDTKVGADSVANVGGTQITKTKFDQTLETARRAYKSNGRPFPKAGTPEYQSIKAQAVQYLVQLEENKQQADDLGVEVTDEQVNARLASIKKKNFGGNEAQYRTAIQKAGFTDARVRESVRSQLVSEGIVKKVTKDVKVTDKDVEAYYNSHKEQYGTPASRDVRHILVSSKPLADKLYAQLQDGASFAALARKYSKDPGSKALGGKLTVSRGQTLPQFDKVAFGGAKDAISRPVKTQYGWHIVEPLSEIRPAKTTPLAKVKDSIRQQLLQDKRNDVMAKWSESTKKDYADKIDYAVGYAPPPTATTGTSTSQ